MLSLVYPRVSDLYSGIDYVFEANTNLVLGSWTNVNYSAGGTNVTGGALNYVTNQIPAVAPQQYIRLRIPEPAVVGKTGRRAGCETYRRRLACLAPNPISRSICRILGIIRVNSNLYLSAISESG